MVLVCLCLCTHSLETAARDGKTQTFTSPSTQHWAVVAGHVNVEMCQGQTCATDMCHVIPVFLGVCHVCLPAGLIF